MTHADGWGFAKPVRKVHYNLTAMSVTAAPGIDSIELLQVVRDRLHSTGGVWDVLVALDLQSVRYIVAGLL
jgi:high-affinity nickel permease